MPIARSRVEKLLSGPELSLYEQSRRDEIGSQKPARLKSNAQRARKLRDKYAGLAKRQAAQARGKESPRGRRPARDNSNTDRKTEIFEDVLSRFEKRLARVDAPVAAKPAAPNPSERRRNASSSAPTTKAKGSKGGKSLAATSRGPAAQKAENKSAQARTRTHLAHQAARGARKQAKSDAR